MTASPSLRAHGSGWLHRCRALTSLRRGVADGRVTASPGASSRAARDVALVLLLMTTAPRRWGLTVHQVEELGALVSPPQIQTSVPLRQQEVSAASAERGWCVLSRRFR